MENLIDLKPLTKPAEMLIKKISNAAGILYEPNRIKREAEAQAKADLIKAKSEIEITGLQKRSARRWMIEEMIHQQNMESITAKALPQLNENADASQMDDDWLANFFAKCRIVSDDEMQTLWSRILAGEANTHGSYSKRTVNCLSEMDKAVAENFKAVCRNQYYISETPDKPDKDRKDLFIHVRTFSTEWGGGTEHGFGMDFEHKKGDLDGVTYSSLSELEVIGLVHFLSIGFDFETWLRQIGIKNPSVAPGSSLKEMYLFSSKNGSGPSRITPSQGGSCVCFTKQGKELSHLVEDDSIKDDL